MLRTPAALAPLRVQCGRFRTILRDTVVGLTRSTVFAAPVTEPGPAECGAPVTFRLGSARDVDGFTEQGHEYGEAEKEFGFHRLRLGDSLVIGEWAGATVFYAWFMWERMDLDQDVIIPIRRKAAYSYKVFTLERARGLGICGCYYAFLMKTLHTSSGCDCIVCRICPGNKPSIHAHVRAGFRPVGDLWKLRLFSNGMYHADASLFRWLRDTVPPGYFSSRGILLKHDL